MSEQAGQPTTFMSYARENAAFVRQLYNDLTAAGVRPWLDTYDIPPGAIWDDEIQHGLDACSHILIIVSEASNQSRNVRAEWNYADSLGKTLIPLIYEQLDPQDIPYRLHGPNWVDFTQSYDTALDRLLTVLPVTEPPNPAAAPEPKVPVNPPSAGHSDPVAAAAAWKRGNAEFHDRNMNGAIDAYTQSIALAPDQPEAYINRGMIYYELGRYNDALHDFEQAEQRGPDIALLYNNRGVTYLALKQIGQALADFDEALLLNPNYANAYYNRAAALMAIGRYRLAEHTYTHAIEINDHVPLFFNSRGLSYAAQHQYDKALADFDQAIRLDDSYAGAYGNRANIYANRGEIDKALDDYNHVIALDPEHILAYAGRSEIHFCAAEYALSALDASTIIGLQPDFHGGYALRALANFSRRRRDDAQADYAKAIQLDSVWQTAEGAATFLTICPDKATRIVRDILAALG